MYPLSRSAGYLSNKSCHEVKFVDQVFRYSCLKTDGYTDILLSLILTLTDGHTLEVEEIVTNAIGKPGHGGVLRHTCRGKHTVVFLS